MPPLRGHLGRSVETVDAGGRYFARRQGRAATVELAFGKDFESNGSVSKIIVASGKDK